MEDYVIQLTFKGENLPSEEKIKIMIQNVNNIFELFDFKILQHGTKKEMIGIDTFDEYQNETEKTAIYPYKNKFAGLLYTSLGLGESGEFQGKIKKLMRDYNVKYDDYVYVIWEKYPEIQKELIAELGDIFWYLSETTKHLLTSLGIVANLNIEKLMDRKKRNVIKGSGDNR